jgi:hypothetical protein
MKKVIGLLLAPVCVVFIFSLLAAPQPRIQHQDSSAFQAALQQAINRLEGGGKTLLGGTATPVQAGPMTPTYDGRYTCDTYNPAYPTCEPAVCNTYPHTADPAGHTCVAGEYTCQMATCDTYDPQQLTCDVYRNTQCGAPNQHTTEPIPYSHTCQGHTCDGTFTCDFTVDPRALTCDAATPECWTPTFEAFQVTCNPMLPECRMNNPKGHCTAENYPTCQPGAYTCDPANPQCATIDPHTPGCATPTEHTTWGKVKERYGDD